MRLLADGAWEVSSPSLSSFAPRPAHRPNLGKDQPQLPSGRWPARPSHSSNESVPLIQVCYPSTSEHTILLPSGACIHFLSSLSLTASQRPFCGKGNRFFISVCMCAQSHPTLATPWTVARQAPLSMGFPRHEYWSGLSFPSPGDLPDPGIEPVSLWVSCISRQTWAIGKAPGSLVVYSKSRPRTSEWRR